MTTYRISDGNATETAATLSDAAGICEDWYDYMVDEGCIPDACNPDLDDSSLDALNKSIRAWQNRIAEACGNEAWAGHGSYYVSAGDRMGLNLSVREVENE